MSGCLLVFNCYPYASLRCDETMAVIDAVSQNFDCLRWQDAAGNVVDSIESLQSSMSSAKSDDFDQHGLTWCAETTGDNRITLTVATGGDQHALNFFRIDFGDSVEKPKIELFKKLIEAIHPSDAFVYDDDAERQLRQVVRASGTRQYSLKSLRRVHYLGPQYIEELGGVSRVMKLPHARKTPIEAGLLLEFSTDEGQARTTDMSQQIEAMAYLGLVAA